MQYLLMVPTGAAVVIAALTQDDDMTLIGISLIIGSLLLLVLLQQFRPRH